MLTTVMCYSMKKSKNKTDIFRLDCMNEDILSYIASFLDVFQRFQFKNVSKRFKKIILVDYEEIYTYFNIIKEIRKSFEFVIKRINTDGVVYGECIQCASLSLLYTLFDGENEKCICLDNCKTYCFGCDKIVSFHNQQYCRTCFNRFTHFNLIS